ncbi:MAG: outer membrane beta-barrel protein [Bacteroidetes bacterium]|nr:outer membrane beta-barrel protein [Bacteroidota bacterium]MBS1591859.1 outer membrane beta-barrel protein [Bacteroidota bacterium]
MWKYFNKFELFIITYIIEYQPSKKIYFQIGPEFNFLLNARMKNKSFDASVIDNYKKFDLAIVGGLGFKLFKGLNIETRYSLGLSQIRQNETIFGAYKTRTFQINLVYLLKLKK